MRQAYLIAYDVRNPRRLARVARFLLTWGLRLQKSVFHVRLNPAERVALCRGLGELVTAEDEVHLYALQGGSPLLYLGREPLEGMWMDDLPAMVPALVDLAAEDG